MPKKNAAQGDGKDSGILLIDERTKAVMTDQPRHAQEAFKEQIAKVREFVPTRSRDDIALVLQCHEGNVDKAVQSFMEDGAKTVLNEWQSHGKKSANKRNKKKKRGPDAPDEKSNGGDAAAANKTGSASATAQPVNNTHSAQPTRTFTKQRPPSSQQQQPRQYQQPNNRRGDRDRDGDYNRGRPHPRGHPGEGRGGDGTRPGRQQPTSAASHHLPAESGKQRSEKGRPSHHTSAHDDMVERLLPAESNEKVHHIDSELHYQDAAKAKKLVAVLERSTKDLHRTSIALTRHKVMLQDKLDQSEKSIPKSFDEIQRFLNERKLAVTNEFLEVKQEATEMLVAREEQAKELERKTHRAATMTEVEVLELRAEIKQFVSDRKVDEEIGKALRYTWNPDKLIDLIKNFAEVIPVQHHYTTRRPSISSLSSINTMSRTTSVSEDHGGPLSARSISLTESQDSATLGGKPRPTNDIDMKAEVAEMAAKLQRSMTQGRKGGARNQTGSNPDNQNRVGDRSQQPNRGQGKAQGQQPPQNQGQGGPNPNKQGRNQNRQDKPQGQPGSRQDKPQGQPGSRQGQQGSKQGPVSQQDQPPKDQRPQGQRPQGQRPQGQRPQGQGPRQGQQQQQRNENEEHDGQKKENRNAKRRQSRKQKERKQPDTDEASNPHAPKATSVPEDKPEEKQVDKRTDVSSNVPVAVSAPADSPQPSEVPKVVDVPAETGQERQDPQPSEVPEMVDVPTEIGQEKQDPQPSAVPKVVDVPTETEEEKQDPQPSAVPKEVDVPTETGLEKQEMKQESVSESHLKEDENVIEKPLPSNEIGQETQEMKQESVSDSHLKEDVKVIEKPLQSNEIDSGVVNGEMKEDHKPKMTNGPLKNGDVNMNGDIKINGDVPHVNGDIIPDDEVNGDVDAPLPQREIKSRRSQKIENVVKETSTLNGDAEQTEREIE